MRPLLSIETQEHAFGMMTKPGDACDDNERIARRSFTISIVTPTFNRCELLERLARSIIAQANVNIEWVVVDDGSGDGTRDMIGLLHLPPHVSVRYTAQSNQGRMVALNRGVMLATGELIAFVDSDDVVAPGILSIIADTWHGIRLPERRAYAGVVAMCGDDDGRPIHPSQIITEAVDSNLVSVSEVMKGDRKEFLRADILKAHPYPTVPGERRVSTSLMWPAISERFSVRVIPHIAVHKSYLVSGMTANIIRLRARSPTSSALRYHNYLCYRGRLRISTVVRNGANYIRYRLHGGKPVSTRRIPFRRRVLVAAAAPLGVALFLRDASAIRHD